jgi:hypothetical protein
MIEGQFKIKKKQLSVGRLGQARTYMYSPAYMLHSEVISRAGPTHVAPLPPLRIAHAMQPPTPPSYLLRNRVHTLPLWLVIEASHAAILLEPHPRQQAIWSRTTNHSLATATLSPESLLAVYI